MGGLSYREWTVCCAGLFCFRLFAISFMWKIAGDSNGWTVDSFLQEMKANLTLHF